MVDVPIRVGVVGLGAFGSHHARHYALHPAANLVALADVDADRAQRTAAERGGAAVGHWRDMIGGVDAVSIAVPASHHAEPARAFIDAGIHVFVEKPIAVSVADARDLVERADRNRVVLQVGHVERFSPAIEELVARVAAPRRVSCLRRSIWNGRSMDVDVVLDMMIHDIGHVLLIAGSPLASVSASGRTVRSGTTDEAEAWLTFADGLIVTLSASRVAERNERKMVVTEPRATFTVDLAAPTLAVADRGKWGSPAEDVPLRPRDNLGAEIAAFLESVRSGTPPLVDGRAGLAALEVAERIRAAIADSHAPARRSAAQ